MKIRSFTPQKFRRRVFGQLWMLALQFVLGMLLNLSGNHAHGIKHAVYDTTLVAHIINAIGLVEGSIYIALKEQSKLAWWGFVIVSVTFGAGVMTVITGQDAWSFVMASGFLASAWLYVLLYIRADRNVSDKNL